MRKKAARRLVAIGFCVGMNSIGIRKKFGDDFIADERTFIMGIDRRFTTHFAERFKDLTVLETCTGAGFTTISLAETAQHVITVELNNEHQRQAIYNVGKAELSSKVTFIHGNVMAPYLLEKLPLVNAAFIDPDWAVTGPDHIYRFRNSNTQPPADTLLKEVFEITKNVALVLPPFCDEREFEDLPQHEREKLYLGDSHELFCLYFGDLINTAGHSEFHVGI